MNEFNESNESMEPAEKTGYTYTTRGNRRDARKKHGKGRWIALALCCVMLVSIVGLGSGYRAAAAEVETTAEVVTLANDGTGEAMSAADVYELNVGSTVGITTSISTNYFGYPTTAAASGSGFIITEDGYILTNYHVIEDSNTITVTMFDNSSYEAKLIGYDESNDIAVLKVEAEGLTPVTLGDSDALRVGEDVIAIGNPLGELTFSLTRGVVSALNRRITLSSGATMDLIQTDCSINSGNSGGALFNMYGEVIGITNAKYSSSGSTAEASIDNIGFAIPINTVAGIVNSIIENGYIAKPYIGVSITDVSEEGQGYGLPEGAAVRVVNEDSPAEAAGLQVNDIITAVDGQPITGSDDLVRVIKASATGDTKTLTVYRQGTILEIEIEIGEQVQSALANEEAAASAEAEEPSSQGQQGQQGQTFDNFEDFEDFMHSFGGYGF